MKVRNFPAVSRNIHSFCAIGGPDYAAACDYILNRFVSLNQAETKQIYTHFTCATDTTQIRFVMGAVNGKLWPPIHNIRFLTSFRYHHPGKSSNVRSHMMTITLIALRHFCPDLLTTCIYHRRWQGRLYSLFLLDIGKELPIPDFESKSRLTSDTDFPFFEISGFPEHTAFGPLSKATKT
jgi:hypothetical protein